MAIGPAPILHDEFGASNNRFLSRKLWDGVPLEAMRCDPGYGILFEDDFDGKVDIAVYTATQATAGTFAFDDALYGVALADCNSATDNQGINIQKATSGVGELFAPTAGHTLVFECRIKAADIATGPQFFIGLHNIDTTIIASGALTDASGDWIGFKSETDDNVILATVCDNTTESTASSIHTFVDDTYVKLGFRVDGTSKARFYVNGVLKGTITSNIPTALMTPSLVCQSAGTTDPIVHIDFWKFAQVVGNT